MFVHDNTNPIGPEDIELLNKKAESFFSYLNDAIKLFLQLNPDLKVPELFVLNVMGGFLGKEIVEKSIASNTSPFVNYASVERNLIGNFFINLEKQNELGDNKND